MKLLTVLNVIVVVLLTISCGFAIQTYFEYKECTPLCDKYLEANCPFYSDIDSQWDSLEVNQDD
jgi:hypothetical protein